MAAELARIEKAAAHAMVPPRQRVSRVQEEAKKTSLLAPIAAKKYRYDIESRAMGSEWKVVEEASA